VQTMAASDGFTVSVPGFNLGAEYSYPFDGYILGDPVDPDVLQTELMADLENEVNQTINGTLRLAFTAQPDDAPGVWWTNSAAPYLSAPDAALNHPFRWTLISESSGPLSSVYCFDVLDRDNVQSGGGYEMKGLFVLAEGATTGPQLTIANDGDTLQLQARVYNYSRLDMAEASPPVTGVRVQFYGQEWDATTQEFTGDAFLIGEDTLDPIPATTTTTRASTRRSRASTSPPVAARSKAAAAASTSSSGSSRGWRMPRAISWPTTRTTASPTCRPRPSRA
jgi:hypothetical protein